MKKEKDLTTGSIFKSLVFLAWPIIMANVLQTMYQLIDTFWLGRLGANAVASVSLSFPILFLVLSLGGGLTLAGTVIVAQHKGANNQKKVNYSSSQTVMVIFLISILLAFVGYFSASPLMKFVGAGPEVFQDSVDYFQVSSWGFIFLFMFFVFQSLMRGIGEVFMPMYIVLATVLLNLVLDPLFIFGYGPIEGQGVAGAAVASIITQGLSAVAGLWILFRGSYGIRIKFSQMKPDFKWIKKLFQLGIPSSLDQSSRAAGMTVMVMLVTGYGSEIVAAYGVGARILSLVIVPALGFAMATTSLVGQNFGAGKIVRTEKVANLSAMIALVGLTSVGLIFFFFAEAIIAFFVPGDEQVIRDGALFIKIMAPSFGLLGVQQVLNGAFNGVGMTTVSMLISIFSLWIVRFPLAWMLSEKTTLSYEGIWWAFPASNLLAAIVAFAYFKSGTWKKRKPVRH
ncbi:putative efflux protein, MATE family [Owenweeksia hongkongensis DSM 17368]|uniref:Multidrug-efflux transporter n=1 Tax=Owenweeksia hongkongensis (strain DSM 17368 / CIP 108786 / JCM 12287 / NRRL B-23963 / UST20020801) TaxID=926562 RepID=G8R5J5_OWEHD|nr:MATE family efflux transporter [Owenweeksia hongkongensis]AEV33269.1 putative efflux protein, MATE family [Owenweeksia hongkongensis DSM 17368]